MKVAVLSGKGGAGKTFVSVNLAAAAGSASYIDCDVEEPNGHLFLKPEGVTAKTVTAKIPEFDPERCSGCRSCVDFCRFNALFYVKGLPKVFTEVCHSCGGCMMVCPEGAIKEIDREIGRVETGYHGSVKVITGLLNIGEASGGGVIRAALKEGESDPFAVIDCPPGSACSVMESIEDADYCILVAEPTAFGYDNFRMVHELATLLGKPCGVITNKETEPYEPLERFCKEQNLPILMRIPYSEKIGSYASNGWIACEQDADLLEAFCGLYRQIGGAL